MGKSNVKEKERKEYIIAEIWYTYVYLYIYGGKKKAEDRKIRYRIINNDGQRNDVDRGKDVEDGDVKGEIRYGKSIVIRLYKIV